MYKRQAKIGKQAELVLEGEDTELDRTIVEEISDPLIHMAVSYTHLTLPTSDLV